MGCLGEPEGGGWVAWRRRGDRELVACCSRLFLDCSSSSRAGVASLMAPMDLGLESSSACSWRPERWSGIAVEERRVEWFSSVFICVHRWSSSAWAPLDWGEYLPLPVRLSARYGVSSAV